MRIGYARVSTQDQSLDLQLDALKKAGCEQVFEEKLSGAKAKRTRLEELKHILRKGDQVVVWKLDRLGRSLRDLVELINYFDAKGVEFQSIQDKIDTSTPVGQFTFHIFAAVAQFERDIIRMRTIAGLQAARARGRNGGRPKGLSKSAKNTALAAETLYKERKLTISEICRQLGIARSTLYKYLRYRGIKIGKK